MIGISAHIGPTDHIDRCQVHAHQDGVVKHLIGNVDTEEISEETEAVSDGTVLTAEEIVGVDIKNDSGLAQFGLSAKSVHVVLAVLVETSESVRSAVWH